MSDKNLLEDEITKQDLTLPPPEHEPQRQYYFMAKCRQYTKRFFQKNGRFLKACVVNFGCPFV